MKYILILISIFFIACSDTTEDIKPIIELDPNLNNGVWEPDNASYSFSVDSLTVYDIVLNPRYSDFIDASTYEFRKDTLQINVKFIDRTNGAIAALNWLLKWELGSVEAKGYSCLSDENGNPRYETKNDITFLKQ